MSKFRTLAVGGVAALTLALGAVATPAAAQHWGGGGYGYGGWGAPVAAGVAAGTLLGAAAAAPYYYGAPPRGCGWQRQPTYDPYGNFAGWRRAWICY